MARRKSLSDIGIAALKPRSSRYAEPDPELVGHYVRVTPGGAKSFVAVARDPGGKQVWATIGATNLLKVGEAREKAREAIKRIKAGLPPVERPKAKPQTFGGVSSQWLTRHVEAKGLRSEKEIRRLLDVHVLPRWRDREFIGIRRTDVVDLLDTVEDGHSARQADYVLNVVRSIANWYATRHDDYTPPIVRGMRRQDPRAQARARILEDEELRNIWKAAEANGTFGALLRVALLTAQRRTKVVKMRWEDISPAGEWTIPKELREKDTAGSLLLPDTALAIIRERPQLASNPHVFAGRGDGHFFGFSQAKARFDEKLEGVEPWVIHDLRRTARSLMARAGVRPDIAERVMGHVIAGVEGVYDRHSYRDEKADALRRLAGLVETIVNPRVGNVVALAQ
jgi:integrase